MAAKIHGPLNWRHRVDWRIATGAVQLRTVLCLRTMSAVIRINSPLFNLSRTYFHSHPRPRIRARLKLAYPAQPRSRPFSSSPPVQATHHDTPASSLLSQTLDQRQRMSKANQADNVGPFTLGMVQQPMGVNDQPLKKWKDLDTKGKGTTTRF